MDGRPFGYSGHGAAFDTVRGHLLVFAGAHHVSPFFEVNVFNDLWALGAAGWTNLAAALPSEAAQPTPRQIPAAAFDDARGRLVVFGGFSATCDDGAPGCCGDTWEWDGGQWHEAAIDGPSPRVDAAMVYDDDAKRVLLYGGIGCDDGRSLRDLWSWDGVAWRKLWPPVVPQQTPCCTDDSSGPERPVGPSGLSSPGIAWDSHRRRLVLFGGRKRASWPTMRTTWEWDGVSWHAVSTDGPAARDAMAMTYDPMQRRTVLHGGRANANCPGTNRQWCGDTWTWDGATWTELDISGPEIRFGHSLTWDPAAEQLISYGGFEWGGCATDGRCQVTWALRDAQWTRLDP